MKPFHPDGQTLSQTTVTLGLTTLPPDARSGRKKHEKHFVRHLLSERQLSIRRQSDRFEAKLIRQAHAQSEPLLLFLITASAGQSDPPYKYCWSTDRYMLTEEEKEEGDKCGC